MTIDLNSQLLRSLRAVLETGSLTAAAERLGFTQSALSKQISALEAAVGAQLFRRGPRGLIATDAANRLAVRAAVVLEQLDAVADELDPLHAPLGGRVALGGFPATAAHLVPRMIARVGVEHPSVTVSFTEGSTPVQLRRLRAGRLELAIIAAGADLPEWETTGIDLEPLPAGQLLVAVAGRHRFARARRVDVDALSEESWVVGRGLRGEPQFGAWPTLHEPRVVAELTEWSARFGFVAAGLGITTVPALLIDALPRGVVAVSVVDPGWRGRSMLLARIGRSSPSGDVVRAALFAEAELIARPRSFSALS